MVKLLRAADREQRLLWPSRAGWPPTLLRRRANRGGAVSRSSSLFRALHGQRAMIASAARYEEAVSYPPTLISKQRRRWAWGNESAGSAQRVPASLVRRSSPLLCSFVSAIDNTCHWAIIRLWHSALESANTAGSLDTQEHVDVEGGSCMKLVPLEDRVIVKILEGKKTSDRSAGYG